MPIHGRIISQVISKGSNYIAKEAKFWRGIYGPSGRYAGVSNYKQAAKGVQHGLLSGSILGSFINDGSSPYDDGFQKVQKSYKFNQKYRRRHKSGRRCRCNNRYKVGNRRKRLYR